jgi:hypothetical protein
VAIGKSIHKATKMKTKELGIFGLQSNMIAGVVEDNITNFLLANGNTVKVHCATKEDAARVLHTVLYYTPGEGAAGIEFDFKVDIVVIGK